MLLELVEQIVNFLEDLSLLSFLAKYFIVFGILEDVAEGYSCLNSRFLGIAASHQFLDDSLK